MYKKNMIATFITNIIAGVAFGIWVKTNFPMPSTQWHVLQIAPLLAWMLSFANFGYIMRMRKLMKYHNVWGYMGRLAAALAACAVGYIIGLELGA